MPVNNRPINLPAGLWLMNSVLTLSELEAAINYWRSRSPSQGDELALCPQAAALAEPYAMLIFERKQAVAVDGLSTGAQQALEEWRDAIGGA